MAVVLDIIGGLFVGGFLLIIALTAVDTATTEFFNYNADAIQQQNLARTSDIIQYDLRKMGYGTPEAQQGTILQIATPSRVKFLSHLNSDPDARMPISGFGTIDNVIDTIEYMTVPLDSVDYFDTTVVVYQVRRTIKISPNYNHTMSVGVIGNQRMFRYLNQLGEPVGIIAATKMIEVTLTAYDPRVFLSREWIDSRLNEISNSAFRKKELRRMLRASYWRQTRLISRNLKR
jgi:hypothetical protein